MNIYESFHLVQRNSTWAGRDDRMHFSKFAADQAPEDTDRPAPIPAMCSCKWCCKWTVCEHTGLLAYVFCPDYQVPEILVAETPALRKKTNSIRGTAGVRRRELIKKIAKNKQQSTNRLEYMDPPVHPSAPRRLLPRPRRLSFPKPYLRQTTRYKLLYVRIDRL